MASRDENTRKFLTDVSVMLDEDLSEVWKESNVAALEILIVQLIREMKKMAEKK